jgi:hypothetical protein
MGPIERISLCLRTPTITPVTVIKPTQQRPTDRVGFMNLIAVLLIAGDRYLFFLLGPSE